MYTNRFQIHCPTCKTKYKYSDDIYTGFNSYRCDCGTEIGVVVEDTSSEDVYSAFRVFRANHLEEYHTTDGVMYRKNGMWFAVYVVDERSLIGFADYTTAGLGQLNCEAYMFSSNIRSVENVINDLLKKLDLIEDY